MNTFRRPMFRGGPVDSRGTGITSGLSYKKGGRVGYDNGGQVTGGSLMDRIRSANSLFFNDPARFAPGFDRTQPRTFLGMNIPGTGSAVNPVPFQPRNFAEDALFFAGPGKFLKAGGGGLNMIRAGRNFLRGKPSTSKELVPQGYKFGDDFLGDFRRNLSVAGGGIRDIPGVSPLLNLIARNPRKSIAAGTVLGLSDVPGAVLDYLSKEDTQRMLLPGVLERAILDNKEDEKKTTEGLQDEVDNEAALQTLLKAELEKNKKRLEADIPKEEDIEINKEKYAELLGGDKARGEDISNMLLSFAGKALEPGATAKSAFGEFAAEQAKTPSKRSKVEETAAALAINEYIAGKKSKAELDRFFMEMDYKKNLASRTGKENIAINIAEAGKSNSGYKAVELGLQMSFRDAGRPIKIEKGQANDVPLTADNFGKIFIEEEAPYTAVKIDIKDGVLFRDFIY